MVTMHYDVDGVSIEGCQQHLSEHRRLPQLCILVRLQVETNLEIELIPPALC